MVPIEKLSLYTVTPVWVLLALAAASILLFVPAEAHLLWFSISLAAGIILTFCIQLGLDRKEGLVNRVMASLGGSIIVLAIATGVSALLG
jgi:hypothetical protein